jgi:uncharacterized protein
MFYNFNSMRGKIDQLIVPELQFNVAQLLKETTGSTRSYNIIVEPLGELDEDVAVVGPMTGHVKFLQTGRDILATGLLETTVEKTCGRCLTLFTTPISIELEEEFYPILDIVTGTMLAEPEDGDEANRIDEHHILDLWEVVRQDILLESDGILYCRPDCKGLCPHCGQDRNEGECGCQDEEVNGLWAVLRSLQIED